MIIRETDAERINRVSNLPGVRDFVCYKPEPMDWTPAFPSLDSGIIILSDGEDACAAFDMTDHRVFKSHTFFGPKCRGRQAIETAKAMLEWMKPHADFVWGATPKNNRKALWFNRQIGAVPIGEDEYEVEGPVQIFRVQLADEKGTGIVIPDELEAVA